MSGETWEDYQNDLLDILISNDLDEGLSFSRNLLDQGVLPVEFYEKCVGPVMEKIGNLFENLDIFLPEMAQAGMIVKQISEQVLKPEIKKQSGSDGNQDQYGSKGKIVLATVQGDLHDIGKNMVGLMLGINGFEVVDLGTDVSPREIVEIAEREDADIIGLSSLLTTCLPYMKDVIAILDDRGLREKFKVIIGGASPTLEFALEIGADGFGQSAPAAVKICNDLTE